MRKYIFVSILFMCTAISAYAQDIIFKKDGSEVKAKIVSVTESTVEYKRFDYLDGPTFTIKQRDIEAIMYANGTSEKFVDVHAENMAAKGIAPGMSYREYRKLYNSRDYVRTAGDPYTPVGAGIGSLFIPGLGQMINGQVGKGVGILCGSVALATAGGLIAGPGMRNSAGKYVPDMGATVAYLLCFSGALALDIWSICDAVKVAKIKNMYYQDCAKLQASTFDIKLMPNFAMTQTGNKYQPTAGFMLSVQF